MVRFLTSVTAVMLTLGASVMAKDCRQIYLTYAGDNIGSATSDCEQGCLAAYQASHDKFDDICQSNDGWGDPAITKTAYVGTCEGNTTNCDSVNYPYICSCEGFFTMWRAFAADQTDGSDVVWSCDPVTMGNRLALQSTGYLLGRGAGLTTAVVNKEVDCS